MSELDPNAIAIVGMAGRFPGARDVRTFWRNLRDGVESIERLDDEALIAAGVPEAVRNAPDYVRACAFLEDPDRFDAPFFHFAPVEAELLDPQQRVFLEVAWEAFEDAGHDPARFDGPIGVFAGAGKNHYAEEVLSRAPHFVSAMGAVAETTSNEKDFTATRVSYKLDLRGPSVSVQTACSTSLVAVHLACQSLLSHECDMALAGGSSISAFQRQGYRAVHGGIFSPDGHLRAFDAQAAGQVGGSGSAAVVLRRLEDALADGDDVRAVILGSAVNNDGLVKVSFTAPGVEGQAAVVAEALEVAGVEPDSIGYVECHGTGTRLGDPIEVTALTQAFRAGTDRTGFCAIGSVKTNVGHLDAASGVTGLIKAALAVRDGVIPKSLHFETPNPELALETSPFFVAAEPAQFPADGPRRAGVSSFGMGGTNAHVVLEEPPSRGARPSVEQPRLLVLSARTREALDRAAENLAERLEEEPRLALDDVAFTLAVGRRAFEQRLALVASSPAEAADALRRGVGRRGDARSGNREASTARTERPVVFLFSGQGSQYAGMTRGLYARYPVFREALDQVLGLLRSREGLDLAPWILLDLGGGGSDEASVAAANRELARTEHTQPALFAVEWALAKLLASFGVEPDAMLGHSVGEYVAATIAGVFTLEAATRLVAARGRLIGSLPSGDEDGAGAMLAIPLRQDQVEELLGTGEYGRCEVAVVNTRSMTVVGGPLDDLERLRADLRGRKVAARKLITSHAFHTSLMEPILAAFEAEVRAAQPRAPKARVVSCTTAEWLTDAEATDPSYWVRHLRSAVRFGEAVETACELGGPVCIEVGPGETLATLAPMNEPAAVGVPVTRHPKLDADDVACWLDGIGKAFCEGAAVRFEEDLAGSGAARVPLPTYPFARERYWVEPERVPAGGDDAALARLADAADWTWSETWRRSVAPLAGRVPEEVTIVGGPDDLADAVAARLGSEGARARRVAAWDEARGASAVVDLGLIGHLTEDDAEERAFFAPMRALAAVASDVEAGGEAPTVVFAARGLEALAGEVCEPEKALVLGIAKAVRAEIDGARVRCVDVGAELEAGVVAEALVAELADTASGGVLRSAWRPEAGGAGRWLVDVERVRLAVEGGGLWTPSAIPSPHPPKGSCGKDRSAGGRFHAGAVILITGGLGGIGLALAEGLARDHRARLLLLSRRGAPDDASTDPRERRTLAALERLREHGSDVLVLAADVADEASLRAAVERGEAQFGPVEAVIHAAGVPGGGLLALRDEADARAVLAPKVRGTRNLARVLADRDLCFFALCSSLATAVDGVGQADYFAANAFLDSFARAHATEVSSPVVSIGWEAWRDVGMAAETEVSGALAAGREESLRFALDADEGRDVFARVLRSGLPHVLVSTRDLPARIRAAAAEAERVLAEPRMQPEERAPEARRPSGHPRPALATTFVAPDGPTEEHLQRIWGDLLGIDGIGTADDFFELGGNSLLLMQLSVQLKDHFDVGLTMRDLFETPTIASLAERLESLRLLGDVGGQTDGMTSDGGADTETEEFRL